MLLQYKIMGSILIYFKICFHQPLLQSKVSHDRSEIILICWFIIRIINVVNSCAAKYFFWETAILFQDSLMNKKFKRTAFIQNINLF